jgi:hypothetical protein
MYKWCVLWYILNVYVYDQNNMYCLEVTEDVVVVALLLCYLLFSLLAIGQLCVFHHHILCDRPRGRTRTLILLACFAFCLVRICSHHNSFIIVTER